MLDLQHVPDTLKSFVNDYRMHLVQIPDSDHYCFQNSDVQDFFEIMRCIYRRDYHKIEEVYGKRDISAELGLAIGAAESRLLIHKALKSNDKGGVMNMCTALQELMNEGIEQGKREGMEQGKREGIEQGKREGMEQGKREGMEQGMIAGKIEGIVMAYKEFGVPQQAAAEKLQIKCGLSLSDAQKFVAMYYLS